jgi:predicted nucleic acid-binding protein
MNAIFLDTGYLLALEISNDQHHKVALKHWQGLVKSLPPLVTTTFVFDETVTFFNTRGYHARAVEAGNNLLNSPSVHLVHVDRYLFQEGWTELQKHKDKDYSLTDCISFIVMRNSGISTVLTFDRHFTQTGFKKLP